MFGLENIYHLPCRHYRYGWGIDDRDAFRLLAYKEQLTTRMFVLIEQIVQFKMLRLHLDRIADIALHEQEPHREKGRKQIQMRGKYWQ